MRSARKSGIWPACSSARSAVLAVGLAGAALAHAQDRVLAVESVVAAAPSPQSQTIEPGNPTGLLSALPQRDRLLGLTEWNHTLLGAFQLGARLLHFEGQVTMPAARAADVAPAPAVLRFSAFGPAPKASLDAIAKALRMDQLQRQGMNLNLKSAYGSFRLQYREIFSGRANSLGGGVGQASAAATYTSPRFGSGLMDFSAAALMGAGSINQLLGTGFGNSNIGGNGPGRKSQTAPTVAIKLTF